MDHYYTDIALGLDNNTQDITRLMLEERHTMQAFARDEQALKDKQAAFERDVAFRRNALLENQRKEKRNASIELKK
jgi:hypothetical protein